MSNNIYVINLEIEYIAAYVLAMFSNDFTLNMLYLNSSSLHGKYIVMMTSSNVNIFRVTGPLWIPLTKAGDSGALMYSLICARINGLVNNRETGDLRRHRPHYDVIIMVLEILRYTKLQGNKLSIYIVF